MGDLKHNAQLAADHARIAFRALPKAGKIALGVVVLILVVLVLRGCAA